MNILVIGGTGPTGHFIVNGLRKRKHKVTIFHSGRHEIPEIPEDIEHIHANAFSIDSVRDALSNRNFDLCISAYGRLRRIAEFMVGRVDRFISIGGVPVYRGFMNPVVLKPMGLPVPTDETAPLINIEQEDKKGWRIVKTEEVVFDNHPDATHFRYPFVYGAYQLVPREWCIVRRILDNRPHIIIPDNGLMLYTFGCAENIAHAVLLAVDKPEKSKGQIFNCGDEEVFSLRQVVDIISSTLEHEWEIVSIPWDLAVPARPMMMQMFPSHRVLSIVKLQRELGYHDIIRPADAIARTAKWLAANKPEKKGEEETLLQDPFDYDAEDKLIASWKKQISGIKQIYYKQKPGFGKHYSGPGGQERSSLEFK